MGSILAKLPSPSNFLLSPTFLHGHHIFRMTLFPPYVPESSSYEIRLSFLHRILWTLDEVFSLGNSH